MGSPEIRKEQELDTREHYEVRSGIVKTIDGEMRHMQQNKKKN